MWSSEERFWVFAIQAHADASHERGLLSNVSRLLPALGMVERVRIAVGQIVRPCRWAPSLVAGRVGVMCGTLMACAVWTCAADAAGWAVQPIRPPTIRSGGISDVSCVSRMACIAVGSFENNAGRTVTLAERWDGRRWSVQRTPDPRSGGGGFSAVSCTSRNACTAVGSNVVERWNGRRWSIQLVRSSASFNGVSCWAARGCIAVGENSARPFAEHWAGHRWRAQRVPDAGGEEDGFLGVSCPSATACMAVGFVVTDSDGDTVTLAERWDGRRWSFQGSLDAGGSDQFNAVWCVSARSCTAVGSWFNLAGTERPMVERWNRARWSFELAARPARATTGRLVAVSCPSRLVCTAVGSYQRRATSSLALVERSQGAKWSVHNPPGGGHSAAGALSAVSCTSASVCTSIGSTQDGTGILAGQWTDRRWSSRPLSDPMGPLPSTLNGVSCASATACTAVGSFQASANAPSMPMVEVWNGVHWRVEPAPSPTGAASGQLNAVACTSPADCTAVGSFSTANGPPTELIEVSSGGVWKIQSAPRPANSTLYGVSCASSAACVAVGSSNNQMLAEVEEGSAWTIDSPPQPSGASTSRLNAVSCNSATVCVAVGYVTELETGLGNTLAETWNGSGWKIQSTPNAAETQDGVTTVNDQLNAVSCVSSRACTAVGTNSDQTLTEGFENSAWTIESSPNPGGVDSSVFTGVACYSSEACTAIGYSQRSGNDGEVNGVLAEERSAGNWAIVAAPSPSGGKLNQVSCATAEACTAVGNLTTSAGLQLPLVERFS